MSVDSDVGATAAGTAPTTAEDGPSGTDPTIARGVSDASLPTELDGDTMAQTERGAPADSALLVSRHSRIQQYEIIRELGRGGMGQVFLARDTRLGRRVAIKFLLGQDDHLNQRFLNEAKATAQCNHENIVVIHEVNEFDGAPFIVFEYLEGETLYHFGVGRTLPVPQAVEIIVPVVRALTRAHEFNITHRDLKPENIFLTRTGVVKVLDFGIAKFFSDGDAFIKDAQLAKPEERPTLSKDRPSREQFTAYHKVSSDHWMEEAEGADRRSADPNLGSFLTRQGAILGTAAYMAPEQWGRDEVDPRTDLWAVGLMLYELVAGENPLAHYSPHKLMTAALDGDRLLPRLNQLKPDAPEELVSIVERCLLAQKEARYQTAEELLADLEPLLPGRIGRRLGEDESPYPGLTAFQERDAGRFFGRELEISRAANQLRELPLLAIVGPSGIGKSSFVRAGLVPRLKQRGESWEVIITRPGRHPIDALAGVLQSVTGVMSGDLHAQVEEQEALNDRLRREPGYLGTLLRSKARQRDRSMLLFIDQFEELYTLVSDPLTRQRYLDCLTGAADDAAASLRVVVSMRSDFLDRASEHAIFMEQMTRGLIFLRPLDERGLREAIALPAELAGYRFESGQMVELMIDSLRDTPGALPLLQFAASRLWENRKVGPKLLTEEAYNRMGGVSGALAAHADEVVAGLGRPAQRLIRMIFQRLVTADGTRAMVDMEDLVGLDKDEREVGRIVDYLVEARLLVVQTSDDSAGGRQVELVHESLISSWPALRRWLEETHEDALFLEQLRTAAKQWEARGRKAGLLWRGEAMEEGRRFRQRYKGNPGKLESEFLDAVLAHGTRIARIKRWSLAALILFLLCCLGAGAVALVQIRKAQRKAVKQADVARLETKRAQKAEADIRKQYELIKLKEDEIQRAHREVTAIQLKVADTRKALQAAKKAVRKERKKLDSLKAKEDARNRALHKLFYGKDRPAPVPFPAPMK